MRKTAAWIINCTKRAQRVQVADYRRKTAAAASAGHKRAALRQRQNGGIEGK
jgi:hypothetical protein